MYRRIKCLLAIERNVSNHHEVPNSTIHWGCCFRILWDCRSCFPPEIHSEQPMRVQLIDVVIFGSLGIVDHFFPQKFTHLHLGELWFAFTQRQTDAMVIWTRSSRDIRGHMTIGQSEAHITYSAILEPGIACQCDSSDDIRGQQHQVSVMSRFQSRNYIGNSTSGDSTLGENNINPVAQE